MSEPTPTIEDLKSKEFLIVLRGELTRLIDKLNERINQVESNANHQNELICQKIASFKVDQDDHEVRLRSVSDGVLTFKVVYGLLIGGGGILSIIAILKAFISP